MKRKITEIFIEVEETVALRLSERISRITAGEAEAEAEKLICPQCGQVITNITEKKIKRRETDDKF